MKILGKTKDEILAQIRLYQSEFFIIVLSDINRWKAFNDDDEIFKCFVEFTGNALAVASLRIRNDKELVCNLIKFKGGFFEYAADELHDDEDVVIVALEHDDDPKSVFLNLSERLDLLLEGLDSLEALECLKTRRATRKFKASLSIKLKEKNVREVTKI